MYKKSVLGVVLLFFLSQCFVSDLFSKKITIDGVEYQPVVKPDKGGMTKKNEKQNVDKNQNNKEKVKNLLDKDDEKNRLAATLARAVGKDNIFARSTGEIMSQAMWNYLFLDEESGGHALFDSFNDGVGAGVLELSKWSMIISTMSGIGNSTQKVAENASKDILQVVIGGIAHVCKKAWNVVFRNGAASVTTNDIKRWKRWINKMIKDLKDVAHKSHRDDAIGQRLRNRDFKSSDADNNGNGDDKSGKDEKVKRDIDIAWLQNKIIYLRQISQIVRQIESRKKFYRKDDEILFCLDELIAVLIGRKEDVIVEENGRAVPGGGIYALINNVQGLADFASPDVERALDLFQGNSDGLMMELDSWVTERGEGSFAKHGYLEKGGSFLD